MSHKTLFAGGRRVASVEMPVNPQKLQLKDVIIFAEKVHESDSLGKY
jgi:hypothetical protein